MSPGVEVARYAAQVDSMNAQRKTPRIPLILGVTGHRNLRQDKETLGRIRELICEIFNEFRQRYPHTSLLLLSPLARGADRLVAEVSLEPAFREWITLMVPMPFPEAEYRQDFKADASEEEFDRLLQAARIRPGEVSGRLFHMPVLPGTDLRQQAARDRQYALGGEFVAHYSQVLIALWDGKISVAPNACGAGAIVNFKLKTGVFPELSRLAGEPWLPPVRPLDVPQTGPVYHILVPRERDTLPPEEIRLVKLFHRPTDAEPNADAALQERQDTFFQAIFKQIDAFNEDVETKSNEGPREQLLPEENLRRVAPELRELNGFYAAASACSLKNQTRARALLLGACLMAFLAVVVGALRSQKLPQSEFLNDWLGLYIVFLVASAGCWVMSVMLKWPDKYQDYRALAEGLRVQFYWRLAGLKCSVSDHYLSKQKSELEWVRRAINNCELAARCADARGGDVAVPATSAGAGRSPDTQALLLRHWVEGQVQFFTTVLQRDAAELMSLKNMGQGLVIFALAAVALFFGSSAQPRAPGVQKTALPLLVSAIPSLATVVFFVVKEWRRRHRDTSSNHCFWMGIWKMCCGILTGLVFSGLLFDLPRLWPRAFGEWDSLMRPTRIIILCAAGLMVADSTAQVWMNLKRWRGFIRRNPFLLAEQMVVHCWHGFLAAILLVLSLWLQLNAATTQPAPSTAGPGAAATAYTPHERSDIQITIITLTLALGALLQYYAEKKALDAHLRECVRMKDLFGRAAEKLNARVFQPGDPDDPVKELGEEALLENSTWLLAHRERPLEMPKAG